MTVDGGKAPRGPGKTFPGLGCLAFIILLAVAGALAAGGSFWSWIVVAALVIIGGIALAIVLARRNRGAP